MTGHLVTNCPSGDTRKMATSHQTLTHATQVHLHPNCARGQGQCHQIW